MSVGQQPISSIGGAMRRMSRMHAADLAFPIRQAMRSQPGKADVQAQARPGHVHVPVWSKGSHNTRPHGRAACRSRTSASCTRPVRGLASVPKNARCISPWPQADTRLPHAKANAEDFHCLVAIAGSPPASSRQRLFRRAGQTLPGCARYRLSSSQNPRSPNDRGLPIA